MLRGRLYGMAALRAQRGGREGLVDKGLSEAGGVGVRGIRIVVAVRLVRSVHGQRPGLMLTIVVARPPLEPASEGMSFSPPIMQPQQYHSGGETDFLFESHVNAFDIMPN